MTTSTVFPASSALCVRKRSINKSKFHGWGLFRHYIALLVVFVVLVSPVFLPLLGAFKSSGDPIYGKEPRHSRSTGPSTRSVSCSVLLTS